MQRSGRTGSPCCTRYWRSFPPSRIFPKSLLTHRRTFMKKYVYSFGGGAADGDGKMKDVLGGKGAGLAEMSRAKLPVPPGFTISTEVCNLYFERGNQVPSEVDAQMSEALATLEGKMGQKLGDTGNP